MKDTIEEQMKQFEGLQDFPLTNDPECSVSVYQAIKEALSKAKEDTKREIFQEFNGDVYIHLPDGYKNTYLVSNSKMFHYQTDEWKEGDVINIPNQQ